MHAAPGSLQRASAHTQGFPTKEASAGKLEAGLAAGREAGRAPPLPSAWSARRPLAGCQGAFACTTPVAVSARRSAIRSGMESFRAGFRGNEPCRNGKFSRANCLPLHRRELAKQLMNKPAERFEARLPLRTWRT